MIPIETQIFRLIFPPSGAIPLEKIEAVPLIRQHIDSIIDLASTEHGISSPGESAALTARVIELRDTPGPDGKTRTWRTIAEICGTTLDAVRHRYNKGKATIRKSRTVEEVAVPDGDKVATIRESRTSTEKPTTIPTRLTMCGDFTTIRGVGLAGKPVDAVGAGVLEERSEVRTVEKPASLDSETLTEVDRMLGEGMGVLDITAELEMKGKHVPWTKIRARAAYLAKMKRKEAKPEPKKADDPEPAAQPGEEPQEVEALPAPVAISRKELDLRMWDLHQTGKTPEEISDILFAERLYYKPKSIRVRLLSQGAKL